MTTSNFICSIKVKETSLRNSPSLHNQKMDEWSISRVGKMEEGATAPLEIKHFGKCSKMVIFWFSDIIFKKNSPSCCLRNNFIFFCIEYQYFKKFFQKSGSFSFLFDQTFFSTFEHRDSNHFYGSTPSPPPPPWKFWRYHWVVQKRVHKICLNYIRFSSEESLLNLRYLGFYLSNIEIYSYVLNYLEAAFKTLSYIWIILEI